MPETPAGERLSRSDRSTSKEHVFHFSPPLLVAVNCVCMYSLLVVSVWPGGTRCHGSKAASAAAPARAAPFAEPLVFPPPPPSCCCPAAMAARAPVPQHQQGALYSRMIWYYEFFDWIPVNHEILAKNPREGGREGSRLSLIEPYGSNPDFIRPLDSA